MAERIVSQPVATKTQERFADLPTADVDRSTFDMSHPWKGTMDSWQIIPTLCMEILPGDTFSVSSTVFMRLATPIKPVMDNLTADIHYFFVPNRLVWDNWAFFMGERIDPEDDPSTVSVPQVEIDFNIRNRDNNNEGVLADCFGLPLYDPGDDTPKIGKVNALPFRCYSLIWNDWYRNQNLEGTTPVPRDDGPDQQGDLHTIVSYRHKRADYFTRALPWPQKGDPVFLPLGETAPVVGTTADVYFFSDNNPDPAARKGVYLRRDSNDEFEVAYTTQDLSALNPDETIRPTMAADLTKATAATINDIRTAFQIQRLLERDARGGTRYIEIILSHFNVQSPDARLQRPEYLGGGSSRITINPVAATAETPDTPQGNLAAVGTGLLKSGFTHSFTEHGFIMGLLSVRSDLTYQRGLDRMWSRKTRYDHYWPALSHLGEQAILNKEIYVDIDQTDMDDIWGYQERFAEYRYQPGRITGKFRSEDPESLDIWHLSQDFTERPELGPIFLADLAPIDRIVAVPSEPDFLVDCWHSIKATRPMPVYAVPGMVDHF